MTLKKLIVVSIAVLFSALLVCVVRNTIIGEYGTEDSYYIENDFFFNKDVTSVTYDGLFIISSEEVRQSATLNVVHLWDFEHGTLYVLILNQLVVSDSWDQIPIGRENLGYFYVTKNAIYRMPYFYELNDDETLSVIAEINENEEVFLDKCQIVCQENATIDMPDEDGWRQFVEVDGDKRRFRLYNDSSGTTFYERLVWQRNKGLVYYRSGYGAMKDHISFGLNLEED